MHAWKPLVVGIVAVFLACSRSDRETKVVAQESQYPSAPTRTLENEADQAMSMRIREAFSNDPTLSGHTERIEVETTSGIVTLRGSVANEEERQAALLSARRVAGENSVQDRLEIAGSMEDHE